MAHNHIAIICLTGGACTSLIFLPQVLKTVKTRQAKEISMAMYIVLAAGLSSWIIYGIFTSALPVILANAFSLTCTVILLVLKIRYG